MTSIRERKRGARRRHRQAATLTPPEREALSLFYGGREPRGIAEVMGISLGAVQSLLKSAEGKQDYGRAGAVNGLLMQLALNWRIVETGDGFTEMRKWPFRDASPDRMNPAELARHQRAVAG